MAKILGLTDEEIDNLRNANAEFSELDYNIEKLTHKVDEQKKDDNKVILDQEEYYFLLKNTLLHKQELAKFIKESENKINLKSEEVKDFKI